MENTTNRHQRDFINNYAETHIADVEQAAGQAGMAKALSFASVRDHDNPLAERLVSLGCQLPGKLGGSDA